MVMARFSQPMPSTWWRTVTRERRIAFAAVFTAGQCRARARRLIGRWLTFGCRRAIVAAVRPRLVVAALAVASVLTACDCGGGSIMFITMDSGMGPSDGGALGAVKGTASVAGGVSANSPNFKMVTTTGQAPGGNGTMSSPRFQIQGGVVGATQGK
jgi:hypothetical protein